MRKVGFLFFFFAMTLILAIPILLQGTNTAFADEQFHETPVTANNDEPIKKKEETFADDHISKEWTAKWDGTVRLELWFDLKGWGDSWWNAHPVKVKLQKKKGKDDWEDTGQEHHRKPQAKNKKQKDIVFKNIKKGETYRIYFDGHNYIYPTSNRVSYNLYHQFPKNDDYDLKPYYSYNPSENENDELQFSIVKKNNQKDNLHFNGRVSYQIVTDDGKKFPEQPNNIEITSKQNDRKIKIEEFKDEHLPAETKLEDPVSRTKVIVNYVGTIDTLDIDKQQYHLTKEFSIQQFKKTIKDINAKQEGSNLKVSADSKYADGVTDRKWEFLLTDSKDNKLETKHPKDQGRKSEATFTHEDFKNKKSGTVKVTFTAKMYSVSYSETPERISLYHATGSKKVNAPPAPAPPPSNDVGNNNGGNQDKGNDDKPKETPVNKEAKIDIDSKILKDENQVEITAKLKKVDQPKGDWTLTFNVGEDGEKKETFKDSQKSSVTKKFSIKDLEKDKVKVIAKFKGKDKKGKINVKEEKSVKIKEDPTENPPEVNEEAKIKLTSKPLENQQIEISAVLENAEEPKGEWTMIFPYNKEEQQTNDESDENQSGEIPSNESQNDENKRTSNQETITETFDIKDIPDNAALVYVEFKGKDKQNKTIETKLEETIALRNETTPPSSENDTDQTQPNEESQADEDEVVEEVITPPESPNDPNGQIGGELPKTATNHPTGLLIGMLLLIGGGIALYLRRHTS